MLMMNPPLYFQVLLLGKVVQFGWKKSRSLCIILPCSLPYWRCHTKIPYSKYQWSGMCIMSNTLVAFSTSNHLSHRILPCSIVSYIYGSFYAVACCIAIVCWWNFTSLLVIFSCLCWGLEAVRWLFLKRTRV